MSENECLERPSAAATTEAPMRTERRWLFMVEDEDGNQHYIDYEGKGTHADEYFIGTDTEANREANRRATAWENLPGNGWPLRVTLESHGKVGA